MDCVVCGSPTKFIFYKKEHDYVQCSNCETVFVPGGLDQSNMVGGGFEYERNTLQNKLRIDRFLPLVGYYGGILDYGCGNGMLVDDLKKEGISADGYDKFNPKFPKIQGKKYGLVSMVEIIEHTFYPFKELDEIYGLLLSGGIVYIETSFTGVAKEENIPLDEFFYINSDVGHCTIFSHIGLDMLMELKGFNVLPHINRNVRIYKKI